MLLPKIDEKHKVGAAMGKNINLAPFGPNTKTYNESIFARPTLTFMCDTFTWRRIAARLISKLTTLLRSHS